MTQNEFNTLEIGDEIVHVADSLALRGVIYATTIYQSEYGNTAHKFRSSTGTHHIAYNPAVWKLVEKAQKYDFVG